MLPFLKITGVFPFCHVLAKFLKKTIVVGLMNCITEQSIISSSQFGFHPKFSPDQAIHHFTKTTYHSLDKKMFQLTVFCDQSKAFDTISHTILLTKMTTYGICGIAYKWFESYLSGRVQFTTLNNASSPYKAITCGVPQGSVLSPILFLIYINDIIRTSTKLNFLLFADDTTIFINGYNFEEITRTLNLELINATNWIESNKLTLNIDETHIMISSPLMTLRLTCR